MAKESQGPGGDTSRLGQDTKYDNGKVDLQVAPQSAAAFSMVGRFQLLIVSRTPTSSSPFVVKPVTFLP